MQIFDWPWMAGAAIVVSVVMAILVRVTYQRRLKRVSRLGTRTLVNRLVPSSALRHPSGRQTRLAFATLFAAIGMAGPRWGEEATVLRGEGIDIVLAMDASLSMLATDERPTRL